MENKDEKIKQIDVVAIVKAMWQHRKLYFITLPVVIVISCLLILCVPRYYNSTAKLAPELSSFNSSYSLRFHHRFHIFKFSTCHR